MTEANMEVGARLYADYKTAQSQIQAINAGVGYKDAKIFLLNAQNGGLGIDIDFSTPINDLKAFLIGKLTTISENRKNALAAIFHKNPSWDGVQNYEYCLELFNNMASLQNSISQVDRCRDYNNNRLAFWGVSEDEITTGTVNVTNISLILPANDLLTIIKNSAISELNTITAIFNDQ